MAYVADKHCDACGKTETHTNGNCNTCTANRIEKAIRLRLARWNALTDKERVEELLQRVIMLESKTHDHPVYG